MLHLFGVLGGILAVVGPIPYIRDTLKGNTRPNQVSWFIWVILLVIALTSQIASGGKDSLLFIYGDLIGTGIILSLSFFRGERKWHWVDRWSLVGAGLGLLLWYVFNAPVLALAMTIFIDFCGAIPTLRKSFMNPESETLSTWLIVGTGALFSTLAVGELNITLLIYPLYLMLINFGIAFAIELGKMKNK